MLKLKVDVDDETNFKDIVKLGDRVTQAYLTNSCCSRTPYLFFCSCSGLLSQLWQLKPTQAILHKSTKSNQLNVCYPILACLQNSSQLLLIYPTLKPLAKLNKSSKLLMV